MLVIWKVISGKKITEKQVQDLLNKGKTRVIKFRMNSGGSIDAPLVVGVDGRISLDSGKEVFEQKKPGNKNKKNVRDMGILDGVFTKVIGLFKN